MDNVCLVLSAGEVIVPMDLLDYDSSFTPALLRAFGSFVVAANDAGEGCNLLVLLLLHLYTSH